jgi:deoxyribonuclease V
MDIKALAATQRELARRVIADDRFGELHRIGGCDVSLRKSRKSTDGAATIAVARYPDLEVLEIATVRGRVDFPYLPGFLSFRELPLLAEAFAQLHQVPDLLICDGQGLAHPRRFGLACHAGIELGVPTIGCAKSLLCGEFKPFPLRRGRRAPLVHDGETVGYTVCTRDGVKPVYVSPGHRVSPETAVAVVLQCARRYRLPEPIRLAHAESRRTIAST